MLPRSAHSTLLCLIALLAACLGSPEQVAQDAEPTEGASHADVAERPAAEPEPALLMESPVLPEPKEAVELDLDDPGTYDWSRAVFPILIDAEGAPLLLGRKPRITKETRRRTREIHRQTAAALGARRHAGEQERRLAAFLMVRASIEASEQGNHRPLDGRGVVHSLDVKAASRAGSRRRAKYLEAGNLMADQEPHVWLGYGQAGMNSWLWLDNWDAKRGDPRMLGDTVISALTYARGMRTRLANQTGGRIACWEYNDTGRLMVTPWNGKKYRVGEYKLDQDKLSTCMDKRRKPGSERESDAKKEKRCRRAARVAYYWKPGDAQPDNTVAIPFVDWLQLKRATGGKPCPPWKGDEYEQKLRAKFVSRARRYGLPWSQRVTRRDLGREPEGLDQYALWRQVWDAVLVELEDEPFDWAAAAQGEIGTVSAEATPEKLAQERALERDPLALEKEWKKKMAGRP